METGLKIAISIGVVGLAATGGYFYWKSQQDEDSGYDFEDEDEPSKLIIGGEQDKPKTDLGGEPIADIKTTVMLPSGTYFVDRNKVLYYDGINRLWKPDMKLKVYDPESIKKTFIPANYNTWELLPSDEEKYQKLVARYQKDVADLERQWSKIKFPTLPMVAFNGQKVKAFTEEPNIALKF